MSEKNWNKVRFKADEDDYRPVIFPPPGPYWCSGYGDGYSTIVAYMPSDLPLSAVLEYWPEASDVEPLNLNQEITFSDHFPRPSWWKGDL